MFTQRLAITLTISGLLLAVGGCGHSSSDKAGGAVQKGPVVLRMADGIAEETLSKLYADEVARSSHGSLRIEIDSRWRQGEARREEDTIGDVKAGKADIGFDATRGFADAGVTAFDALHAPLLVDSYALQGAVLRHPLVVEMLKGLEPAGVIGLGILPGPLRRPLGFTRPLVRPSDYREQTFGLARSRVATATLRALGAAATDVPTGSPPADYGLDGMESSLWVIDANGFDRAATALTANITLWARPEVLYINRQAYQRLSVRHRKLLADAASAVLEPALEIVRSQEIEATERLCDRSLRFVAGDVAGLQAAVRPVYASFDARTNAFVERIRALARDVAPEPGPTCDPAATGPSVGATTPLDGSYRMRISRSDAAAREPGGAEPAGERYGEFLYVLDRGRFELTQKGERGRSDHFTTGAYVVDGDRLTITIPRDQLVMPNGADIRPGGVFDFRWSMYRDRLTLRSWSPRPGGYPGGVWTRTR